MPSGVSHGAAAPAHGRRAALGEIDLGESPESGSFELTRVIAKNIVGGLQCRQRVAAGVDEGLHAARPANAASRSPGPAGMIDVPRAGWPQRLRGGGRFACRRLSSDEHRQASRAPDALKAAIVRREVRFVAIDPASMPPASKKFLAKLARAVKSAGCRDRRGRFSAARRSAPGCGRRHRAGLERLGKPDARQRDGRDRRGGTAGGNVTGATSSTAGLVSSRSGKSLVPVSMSRAAGDRFFAFGAHRRDLLLDQPAFERGARRRRPVSISWNSAQAAAQSSSSGLPCAPEPAAGSAT